MHSQFLGAQHVQGFNCQCSAPRRAQILLHSLRVTRFRIEDRTATRASLGTISLSSSNRLPRNSAARCNSCYVPARVGKASDETGRPDRLLSPSQLELSWLRSWPAPGAPDPAITMTSTLRRTSSAARSGARSRFPSEHAIINDNVFPFDVATFAQTLPECPLALVPKGGRSLSILSAGLSAAAAPERERKAQRAWRIIELRI